MGLIAPTVTNGPEGIIDLDYPDRCPLACTSVVVANKVIIVMSLLSFLLFLLAIKCQWGLVNNLLCGDFSI